jgi:hypothetical protein
MIETPRLLLRRPTNDDMLIAENLWRDADIGGLVEHILSELNNKRINL